MKPTPRLYPPIFACLPPPQYQLLKQIILLNFGPLKDILTSPRFVTLKYKSLRNELVRAKITLTDEQTIDVYAVLENLHVPDSTSHQTSTIMPTLRPQKARTQRCKQARCVTCSHLNHFTSTKSKTSYLIRHSFTCQSNNLIYLITSKKCNNM